MQIRLFEVNKDLGMVNEWLEQRGRKRVTKHEIPKIGYLVGCDDAYIAASFIRHVEGGYGMFDSLITNPEITPEVRNSALDLICRHTVGRAKELGLSCIFAFSVDNNTLERSERLGFKKLPDTLIALKL